MARDFLAIPGAMVSVEHLFSKSQHLCADQRSSLKAATLTQAMCTKEWVAAREFNEVGLRFLNFSIGC
jgi:hypothetical protein